MISSRKTKVTGEVKVNGEKVSPASYRRNIAYVLQEDFLFATATAKESLEFSATLRLPKTTAKKDRDEIVNGLLVSLGLEVGFFPVYRCSKRGIK